MTSPDPSYVALGDPLAHPLHFLGLELVFTACFALTILDVRARYARGERYALFQWLVVFAYGVAMELLAFNAFPDYEHGQFTVQLYHHKLPLYVTFVYFVFHYTGLRLVARRGLGLFAEAVACGLAILLLDVPFDLAGAAAGWWTWHPSSHDVAQRWLGVPLTSYEWYLLFGAVLAGVCRAVRPRVERRSLGAYVVLAPLVAVAIIVLGIIGFLPFHALEAIGVPAAAIVGAHAAAAFVVAARAAEGSHGGRRARAGGDPGRPRGLARRGPRGLLARGGRGGRGGEARRRGGRVARGDRAVRPGRGGAGGSARGVVGRVSAGAVD